MTPSASASYDHIVDSISRLAISAECKTITFNRRIESLFITLTAIAERGNVNVEGRSDSSTAPEASPPPLSTGIHPTALSSLPEVSNGPPDKRWYTVTVGRYPGVFLHW